ncbi:molecular chaperone DnaJ [Motiliproteus sediminis]|uniref:molecular chaperone DnaJ n=1 Tax=Motiliproteus sediminis TaxID=1468178 RepID=UPI001AEFD8F1|nr:molecular chaperone DnaJ [Motiliproteus sediminis]
MNLVLLLAVFAFLFLLVRTILVRAPRYGKSFLIRIGLVALALVILWLALTGRLHWLFALVSGLLPFIGRIARWAAPLLLRLFPLLQQQRKQRRARQRKSGQQSTVSSVLLRMTLDHDSGNIEGEVLQGPLNGRALDSLSLYELKQLHQQCSEQDGEGLRLLEAYLQRHRQQEWEQAAAGDSGQRFTEGTMSDAEALAILGLEAGASRDEVINAHKRMMARMHPDKGGSNYLASKINQAKEQLLRST